MLESEVIREETGTTQSKPRPKGIETQIATFTIRKFASIHQAWSQLWIQTPWLCLIQDGFDLEFKRDHLSGLKGVVQMQKALGDILGGTTTKGTKSLLMLKHYAKKLMQKPCSNRPKQLQDLSIMDSEVWIVKAMVRAGCWCWTHIRSTQYALLEQLNIS